MDTRKTWEEGGAGQLAKRQAAVNWPQRRGSSATSLLGVAAELHIPKASGKTLLLAWSAPAFSAALAAQSGSPPAADIWQKAYLTSACSRLLPDKSQATGPAGVTNFN